MTQADGGRSVALISVPSLQAVGVIRFWRERGTHSRFQYISEERGACDWLRSARVPGSYDPGLGNRSSAVARWRR